MTVLPALTGPWSGEQPFAVHDPATGREIATVQGGGVVEVDAAVRRARAAYAVWREVGARERGALLGECSRVIEAHVDELAELESLEMGKPRHISRDFDLRFCHSSFAFFGGLADKLPGAAIDLGPVVAHTVHEPYGVVAGIIPFNWPPIHTAGKSAPALAAGNCVLLKPPEQDPLTIMRIVELLATVLPPDVLQVVPGGAETGAVLAGHPGVEHLSFTGSTATGRAVLKLAAEGLTPAVLELGGKNPFVVFDDADLGSAVRGAVEGAFFNGGEACTAASRLLVQEGVHDEFVSRVGDAVRRLRVGPGLDDGSHVGPMVTAAHRDKVQAGIAQALAEGARCVAEAPVPSDPALAGGYWVAPTLFAGVTPDMAIARDELFGPVTAVLPFATEDEAVALANDTPYGLLAAVYTGDHPRARRMARRIDAGVVLLNNFNRALLGTPFGGFKDSGYGREHSIESLLEFTRVKNIREPSGIGEIPEWPVLKDVL
ncbi:aldehyde dehydrogenase family protein [Pseudonocardia ailaonensis]|uniref:Aldehyde dehydrogenase family protein n=1 Tax=Pseudonocardia ailaonensis TaxID=367279 RepID=A0ABN2MZJ3_9PSEU